MVPVIGAGKDRGHDVNGSQMMSGDHGDGRRRVCRIPAGVVLPDHYRF